MEDRCPEATTGNLIDLNVEIRSNIHHVNMYIYGIQQDKTISAEIKMALISDIVAKLFIFLNTVFAMNLRINELDFFLEKCARANHDMNVVPSVGVMLDKVMKTALPLGIHSSIVAAIRKFMKANIFHHSILTGTFLATGAQTEGLKVGLVKTRLISEIQDLYIADIEDLTIDDLCYIRIN